MTPDSGLIFLILALGVATVQCVWPLLHRARPSLPLTAAVRTAASVQFISLSLAFCALIIAHVDSDFTVLNVVQNSHTDKPLLYKITGVWGNHEGSMLLWLWILSLYGFILALSDFKPYMRLKTYALATQGFIAVGVLLFVLLTSNPFERIFPPPLNGEDLNPLLQDIGLAIHPPFLYLGYVGFSIIYSFAIAGLLTKQVDSTWARLVRPWLLCTWSLLTLGIGLGSWWAYRELGWGGWWFWDPVENVSLLPWLSGTALLHSNMILQRRNALHGWVILLAILTFSFSLLGTFLVRSGLLTSVHSFAEDPARGIFILCYIACTSGFALLLYAIRLPAIQTGERVTLFSREGSILINNLFLVTACATVALGTLYPLAYEFFAHQKLSVGAPYFNSTFIPIMLPLLFLMAVGALMQWKSASLRQTFYQLRYAATAAIATACLIFFVTDTQVLFSAIGMGLCAWMIAGTLTYFLQKIQFGQLPLKESLRRARTLPLSVYGVTIAHLGAALLACGVAGSSLWQKELQVNLRQGQSTEIAGFTLRYGAEKELPANNYRVLQGSFNVMRGRNEITTLRPEIRYYPIRDQLTSETAIHYTPFYDLYTVVSKAPPGNITTARIYYTPLMGFVWAGFIFIAMGGMIAAADTFSRRKQGCQV